MQFSCARFGKFNSTLSIFNFILIATLAAVLSEHCSAQDSAPALGDIISYKSFQGRQEFGLVIEVDRNTLDVERYDSGQIETEKLFGAVLNSIEVLVRFSESQATRSRLWKTAQGNFEIEASVDGYDGTSVKLKKEDGNVVTVPLKKLSASDRKFIKKNANVFKDLDSRAASDTTELNSAVTKLIERRDTLIEEQAHHERLAKSNPNPLPGDIIRFTILGKSRYGLVTKIDNKIDYESIDESGELDSGFLTRLSTWTFVDRQTFQPQSRSWSSSDGKFKIEAQLTGIEGKKAVLTKSDDKEIKVDISKLSSDDRKYITVNKKQLTAKLPSDLLSKRDSYGPALKQLLARRQVLFSRLASNATAAKDTAKLQAIELSTNPINLSEVDLTPKRFSGDSFSVKVSVPIGDNARVEKIGYADQARMVAFIAKAPFSSIAKLVVVDVSTGKTVINGDAGTLGANPAVIAFSPSGGTILVFSDVQTFDHQLELWKFDGESLKQISVVSYNSFTPPDAVLFSDDMGVLIASMGDFTFVETSSRIKPTHLIKGGLSIGKKPTLQTCQDGKSIILFGSDRSDMYVLDIESKKCLGGIKIPASSSDQTHEFIEVDSDGKSLVRLGRESLQRFSLPTGELVYEKVVKTLGPLGGFSGSVSPHLGGSLTKSFHGDVYNYDLDVSIGEIDRGSSFGATALTKDTRISVDVERSSGGGFGRGSSFPRRGGFSNQGADKKETVATEIKIQLEKLDLAAIAAHAKGVTEEDVVEFSSGRSVQLELHVPNNIEERLRKFITKTMNDGGIEIAETSDFVMTVSYQVGEPQTETFTIIGDAQPRTRTVTITPKSCRAMLKHQGQTIWSRVQSVSLGRPSSEEDLNQRVANDQKVSAESLLKFRYPSNIRMVSPDKHKKFSWR